MLDIHNTNEDTAIGRVEAALQQLVRDRMTPGAARDVVCSQITAGGGMVRARMTLRAARPLGVQAEPLATGVEALHLASLIHDDVCDQAATRRGAPSVTAAQGPGIAVASGDLLIAAALARLAGAGPNAADRVQCAEKAIALTVRGQLADIAARGKALSVPAYLAMAGRKCGPLLGLGPALVLVSAQRPAMARRCFRAARWLSIAYQVADDLSDVEEDALIGTPNIVSIASADTALRIADMSLARAGRIAAGLPGGVSHAFDDAFARTELALRQARHAF